MFGDEVTSAGVETSSQEAAEYEIPEGFGAGELHESNIEGHLCDDVEEVETGERQLVDEHGSDGVEEDLEGAEEGFAEDGGEEDGFEGGWDVGVEAVDAEGFVMGQVVWLREGNVSIFDTRRTRWCSWKLP